VSIADIQREAKERGLDWATVRGVYCELREQEREKRERPNDIRQAAWSMATTLGSHPFWRFGFASRWGKKVDLHDFTIIPGYDEIGQQIASQFPEYDHDSGTENLFEFLLSPYDKLPTCEELYRKAMTLAEYMR
jgi:hypothetical protein